MTRTVTSSKVFVIADRRQPPADGLPLRRYRIARLPRDARPREWAVRSELRRLR